MTGKLILKERYLGDGVVRDEFLDKEFQKCLSEKIREIIFPLPPSLRPDYVEHTLLFMKEDKK